MAAEAVAAPIRVAIYADDGATKDGPPRLQNCLPLEKGFQFKTVTAKEIRDGALEKFDVLIQPGGSASEQAKMLGEEGRQRIQQFVKSGGGFIGICAGAYLASIEYPWSLGLLDAHVLDRAHWARGEGTVQLRITSAGKSALGAKSESCSIHYENGPLLGPGEHEDVSDYELLAAFDSEIRKNDAPPGVMKGTTAIARGEYGEGRVQCFSPHPEKTPGHEVFLQAAVKWVAERPQKSKP